MPKSFVAALMAVSLTAPVLAAETFYAIFDNTLKGCTVVTSEPGQDPVQSLGQIQLGDRC
jgi:hypothetical protein